MKLFLLILLTSFLFLSCDSDSKKEDNKCSKTNINGTCENGQVCDNGVCKTPESCKNENCPANSECVNNECKCKTGYIDFENTCIADMCITPSPCTEDNKTVCKPQKESPYFTCECDENFHIENNKCVSNEGNPCYPNPCDTEANKQTHKTRCLLDPQDNTKYTCNCDVSESYYEDNGICCKQLSHNEGGICVCNENYVKNTNDECVPVCTEDTVEGFNGYCEDETKICVQGVCVDNKCIDVQCPENSKCSTQNGQAECYCNTGLHMDNNLCCTEHASNVNNECKCDAGYVLTDGKCLPEQGNPCEASPYPCNDELHKNKCVVDETTAGFHCECNIGFSPDENGNCKLTVVNECPDSLICLNSYCVESGDRANEQCLTDEDCHEFNSAATSTCNPDVVGGVCLNCNTSSDCPANTFCEETYHTCKNECDSDSDCPSGRCSTRLGMCLIATCTTDDDCQHGSVCIKDNASSTAMCKRIPCNETACSEFNPNGTCEDGKTCIYGNCVDSCSPNPCTSLPFKTVCSNNAGVITCSCEDGYTENADGRCEPDTVSDCPTGFTCENGYCANRNDAGFVCANDNDCGEYTTCSTPMTLPAGKCTGCSIKADCPHEGTGEDAYNPFECIAGYCVMTCSSQSDCNEGMECAPQGNLGLVCKSKSCTTQSDCPAGYVCDGESLKCERIPCSQ